MGLTYRMILDYYNINKRADDEILQQIHNDYVTARRTWLAEIRKDAEKEYALARCRRGGA